MKLAHPFIILAPFFGLAAFGLIAVRGLLTGADPIWLVLEAIVGFLAVNWIVRLCATLLAAVPSSPARPPQADAQYAGNQEPD